MRWLSILLGVLGLVASACGKDGGMVPAVDNPDLSVPLADVGIRDDLFDAAAGDSQFDYLVVGSVEGDWIVAETDWTGSRIPVPAGWTGLNLSEYGNQYLFNPEGPVYDEYQMDQIREPVFQVLVTMDGAREGYPVPAEGELRQWIEIGEETLGATVTEFSIDAATNTGYLLWTYDAGSLDAGDEDFWTTCLFFFCGTPDGYVNTLVAAADMTEGGYAWDAFHLLIASAPADRWDDLYPIVRQMLYRWIDRDGAALRIELPEHLAPESFPPEPTDATDTTAAP